MPEQSSTKHLIIAGTNKSGTTAVFRYLGDHPDVSLSRFKESQFFLTPLEERDGNVRKTYLEQFLDGGSPTTLFVEATPQYLPGGARVARRIAAVLPDTKLLFMLRNPTDRVVSYFRSSYGQPQLPTYEIEFDQFVDKAVESMSLDGAALEALPYRQRAFRQELRISCYGDFLQDYVDAFGADNILVGFFDQLHDSPRDLMEQVCDFANIDSGIYNDFVFRVENKTRIHRSAALRGVSGFLNARLEPLLNRFPVLRRSARSIYDFINVPRGQDVTISDEARERLDAYFAPKNSELAAWMQATYPDAALPGWLNRS